MKKLTFLLCALVCAGALSAQTYYITGNDALMSGTSCSSWNPNCLALTDGSYTFQKLPAGNDYQFKITNGNWDSNGGKTWGFSALKTGCSNVTCSDVDGDNHNIGFALTNDLNDVTITFDGSTICVTAKAVSIDPSEIVYSIKHGWKDGQDASWCYKDLTPNGDGTYSIRDIYGGTGCNWKSTISSEKWISEPILLGSPAKGDSAVFTLDPTVSDDKKAITITKIGATGGEGGEGGESGGSASDYYLVGTINGANYGCDEDYANLGKYKFVDGKLTATFTEKSYVFVKTGDNNNWYMSETYVEPAESATATLKSANESIKEKLGVPGNVEVHFTLTVNGDGTLTLAYTTGGEGGGNTDPDPEPDPEPGHIVIKVQIPDNLTAWDYTVEPYVYSWATGAEGKFAAQPMSLVDGWYTHTFDVAVANFIIVNGNEWPEGTSRQSVNMENVTADACYIMGNGEEIEGDDGSSWKKTLTATECEATALQAVTVADIYANNGRIYGAEGMRIYTVSGMDVTDQNGQLNGIYIVKAQTGVYKIAVK